MAEYDVYFWGLDSFGNLVMTQGIHSGSPKTTTVTGSLQKLTITDDDDGFADSNSFTGAKDLNQDQATVNSFDTLIPGVGLNTPLRPRFVPEGTNIWLTSVGSITVNSVPPDSGSFYMLSYQETPGGQPQYFGYVTTIPVEPGDSITLSFATGNNPNVPYSSLVCFCRNTLIRTGSGQEEVLIEDLSAGDNVLTRDHGVLPIRWIGSRHISTIDLLFKPNLRPVRVKAGALGDGLPRQDLLVSRQHRFLLRSPIVQELLGTDEALVPAIKLVGLKGIEIAHDVQEVEYFHILFDQHEVICANGAWTESLFTGPEALKSVSPEARAEIETLFPEICSPDHTPAPARVIPDTGKLMKQIVARHKSGGQPVYVG